MSRLTHFHFILFSFFIPYCVTANVILLQETFNSWWQHKKTIPLLSTKVSRIEHVILGKNRFTLAVNSYKRKIIICHEPCTAEEAGIQFKKCYLEASLLTRKIAKRIKPTPKTFSKSALDKLKCLNLLLVSLPRECKPWIYQISYCCGLERTEQFSFAGLDSELWIHSE